MRVADRVPVIITARGGSKGIPGKNIAPCGGKPLIAWTIEAACAATLVDRVIVSTDDDRIADAARLHGGEVPFRRPAELAGDHSSHVAVVQHAVRWLEENGGEYEYIVLIQPTSPLLMAEDIDAVVRLALENGYDSVITVFETEQHPYFVRRFLPDGTLEYFSQEGRAYTRRQDLPLAYAEAGAVYVIRRDILMRDNCLETAHPRAWVLPRERALDVDEPWDLHLADLILTARQHGK